MHDPTRSVFDGGEALVTFGNYWARKACEECGLTRQTWETTFQDRTRLLCHECIWHLIEGHHEDAKMADLL